MPIAQSETVTELNPIELRPLPAQPLVSILVSNYNYGRFIADSVQSALDQTYPNFELIICDDGSTDDSVRIVEEFERKDPRVRLIRKENGGQASGFNAAFAASRGEIVALLDSDDIFLPHKIERIVANFQAHPDAGFGVHRIIRMSADLRRQGVWPMSDPLPSGWYGSSLLQDGGILPYIPPTSGLSFRRELAERLFPLPLQAPLVSCPDQLIYRLAPVAYQRDPGRRSPLGVPSARQQQLRPGPRDRGSRSNGDRVLRGSMGRPETLSRDHRPPACRRFSATQQ